MDDDISNNEMASSATKSYLSRSELGAGATGYNVTKVQTSVLVNSKTYYYRVRAYSNDETPLPSMLSAVDVNTPHSGWDTMADDRAPNQPSGVNVKDIWDDGLKFKRVIITWKRIADPLDRNGVNDFRQYKIYSCENSGVAPCKDIVDGETVFNYGNFNLLNTGSFLYDPAGTISDNLGRNYYVHTIDNDESNRDYYYYVAAEDNADTGFTYQTQNNPVINAYSNVSTHETPKSLNPSIAQPTITSSYTASNYKAKVLDPTGVSSATVEWTTDQDTDSLVEYREAGTSDKFIGTYDGEDVRNHSVNLEALEPGTTYEYKIVSRNSLKNIVEAGYGATNTNVQTLTTSSFDIFDPSATTTTTTATVIWTTPIASDSQVEYQKQIGQGTSENSKTWGDPAIPRKKKKR